MASRDTELTSHYRKEHLSLGTPLWLRGTEPTFHYGNEWHQMPVPPHSLLKGGHTNPVLPRCSHCSLELRWSQEETVRNQVFRWGRRWRGKPIVVFRDRTGARCWCVNVGSLTLLLLGFTLVVVLSAVCFVCVSPPSLIL